MVACFGGRTCQIACSGFEVAARFGIFGTVAILAQGTLQADAFAQAFCLRFKPWSLSVAFGYRLLLWLVTGWLQVVVAFGYKLLLLLVTGWLQAVVAFGYRPVAFWLRLNILHIHPRR